MKSRPALDTPSPIWSKATSTCMAACGKITASIFPPHIMSDYDSDSSESSDENNRKKSSRVVIVNPISLSSDWVAKLEENPPGNGKITVGLRSMIGEHLIIRNVNPLRRTVADIRKAYCSTHKEWKGPPHKSINFILEETHYFLPEDKPLDELGIQHGSVLLLVIGNDLRHTGGYQFPPNGGAPPAPPENIYRVATNRNVTVHNNPPPQDTKTTAIPSYITINAIVNTPGGTVTVNRNTITHKASDQVFYMIGENIAPEFLELLHRAEELLQNPGGQGPTNQSELPFRIDETKIGQSMDLEHAIIKTTKMRTFHPYSLLIGVYILHGDVSSEFAEKALHTRYSLKRLSSLGEHFAGLTQLDQHQVVTLAEQLLGGATLIFFSVNSYPRCLSLSRRGDCRSENDKKGIVYKVGPNWRPLDKLTLTTCINDFSDKEAYLPFHYHGNKAKFGQFCNAYLNSFKFGRFSCENKQSLDEYFGNGFLWACGFVGAVLYTYVVTETSIELERMIHRELNRLGLHVNGEFFLPPSANAELSQELSLLLNNAPITKNRVSRDMHMNHSTLHDMVERGYISHRIILECVKEGAILLCTDDVHTKAKFENATTGAKAMSRIPGLDEAVCEDLALFLKLQFDEDDLDDTLGIGLDIKNARNNKYVTVKVVTSEFIPPALEDAKRDFIIIFGPSVYNQVSGNE